MLPGGIRGRRDVREDIWRREEMKETHKTTSAPFNAPLVRLCQTSLSVSVLAAHGAPSPVPLIKPRHFPIRLPLIRFFLQVLPLVRRFLAFGHADLHFHSRILPVYP